MNEISSDDEIELKSSLNPDGHSLGVSRKDLSEIVEKLDEINKFDNKVQSTVNTLEDCITDSTLSIYDLIENNNKILENREDSVNTTSTKNTVSLEGKEKKLTIDISYGDIMLNIDNVNVKIKSHKNEKPTTEAKSSVADDLQNGFAAVTKYQMILLILLVVLNVFRK